MKETFISTRRINVDRVTLTSRKPLQDVLSRFDHGGVLHKGKPAGSCGVFRLIIGNPLIMREMVKHAPDAGSYAPVTILIDQRPDGVHLSCDRMATFLAPYENEQALKVARDLDKKVEALLTEAAAQRISCKTFGEKGL